MASYKTVIAIATNEVGYLEKATNSMLDSKTANAGKNNYTKYGKDRGCNGMAWCDAFVDWCFIQAYGFDKAKSLLGGFSNYTPTSASYFQKMGRWYTSAKEGDVVFFKNSQRICHTGIVYKVTPAKIYTIEGNTSDGTVMIANGGAVCCKSYDKYYKSIAGYGRPNYDDDIAVTTNYSKGNTYTTLLDLNVRQEPKGEKMKYECITKDGKAHAHFDSYGHAILNKGTRVTCIDVRQVGTATWLLIPSGWICAINDEGKEYIK